MNNPRILFSIPTKHHVEIAVDEIVGLRERGFICEHFEYAAKEGFSSTFGRTWILLSNAFNLIRKAHEFKPDIIYLNSRMEMKAGVRDFLTIFIFKLLYYKKVKFVLKSHGSDIDILKDNSYWVRKIMLPYLKKNISSWLFLSSEEKGKVILNDSSFEGRIFVTKNIVRTEQFKRNEQFKDRLNIPQDHKILLFVGRVRKEKGIHEAIQAYYKIRQSYKAVLIIVGDGSESENIKSELESRNLTKEVILTGFIPEPDVVEFYSNCDILVFPTFANEGFPMALFNSVAAGLSIVTTPIRAATDFLSEPENCLWVKPKNSESVYSALKTLLESDTLMTDMRENNIRKAVLFSKTTVAAELSKTIKTIMEQ